MCAVWIVSAIWVGRLDAMVAASLSWTGRRSDGWRLEVKDRSLEGVEGERMNGVGSEETRTGPSVKLIYS